MVSRHANIAARITVEQGAVFEDVMERDGISESALIRTALEKYIGHFHSDLKWNGE